MTQRETIMAFLGLPKEALPVACWEDDNVHEDLGSAWPYLRNALRPESEQRLNHFGFVILLGADREDWKGVKVRV